MAARTRYPLAATLPPDVLKRTVVPRFGFPFRLLLVLGFLPILLGASVLASYRQHQEERIYTGVRVYGLSLSRMTRAEATGALQRHLQEIGRRRFELRYDDEAIGVTLATMGLAVDESDLNQLAERAWSVGRHEDPRSWLVDQLTLVRHGFDVPVTARLDRERAASVLGRITPDVERVTLNADMSVQRAGDRFEIHTTPAQIGRRLNVEATLNRLQQSLTGRLPESLDLVLEEAPPAVSDADLLPAREAIERLLGGAVEFKDGARTWRLEPSAAFEMLEIVGLRERIPPITARLNEEKLAQFVERTARAADEPAVNPFFEIENGQIVVRPGRNGRLADAQATFELARDLIHKPEARVVEIVFKEDKPWLQPQDLEAARIQANAVLDVPIVLETPALPGITEKRWTLGRAELLQLLVLPSTRTAPREYATLQPAQRPRFEVLLDSGRVANFLGREVAPWVSEDPVDAALEPRTTRVEVPNPDYSPDSPLPERIAETRHRIELRNARDGRGPDYDGTFALLQAALRASYAALPPVQVNASGQVIVAPTPVPTVVATAVPPVGAGSGSTTPPESLQPAVEPRRVTVRLAPRRPRVIDTDLALAQQQANVLIEEPVTIRWLSSTWTVTRDDLYNMLRYQPGRDGRLTAYLSRDGLLAKATAIAREAERNPQAPRSSWGELLPVDIPNTAAVIWNAAQAAGAGRGGELIWTDEDPALMKPDAELPETPTPSSGRP